MDPMERTSIKHREKRKMKKLICVVLANLVFVSVFPNITPIFAGDACTSAGDTV